MHTLQCVLRCQALFVSMVNSFESGRLWLVSGMHEADSLLRVEADNWLCVRSGSPVEVLGSHAQKKESRTALPAVSSISSNNTGSIEE